MLSTEAFCLQNTIYNIFFRLPLLFLNPLIPDFITGQFHFVAFFAIFRLTAPFDYTQGKLKINDLSVFLSVYNAATKRAQARKCISA